MCFNSKFWLKFSLINLLIVALLGLLMRYKIGFEFPYFDQKSLQHSHSHFAFSGWISHTLMVFMTAYLIKKSNSVIEFSRYNKILAANLICSYGMLVSFIIQGYGVFSIFFSAASIVVFYVFAFHYCRALKHLPADDSSKKWFFGAVFFNIISSFGTFFLVFMMISQNIHQEEYLASIFYYLHFQYNGWFFFSCMGLLYGFLNLKKSVNSFYNTTFYLFFISCLPAYFLSTLWANLPIWLYLLTILAAVIQVATWYKFLIITVQTQTAALAHLPYFLRYILLFIAFAVSVKVLLQLGSTIPAVSKLTFGFRPIVIAYLHLVLLAIISLFLLFYMYANEKINCNTKTKLGVIIFSVGVLINELILAVQGIASFSYTLIPYVNELLLGAALVLVFGIGFTTFYTLDKIKIARNL